MKFRVQPREDGKASLYVECSHHHSGECRFSLWQGPSGGAMWNWDGNIERPTITPSIDCKGECGRHFTITNGNVN